MELGTEWSTSEENDNVSW